MDRLRPDATGVARAAELVRQGEVIAFPTDTVYGLMALPDAAERIYEVKRRPAEKRLIVMAPTIDDLESVVRVSERARAFAARWWPGPLTMVLPAAVPGPSVGVRIPDHPLARELLRAVGRPVVTTSANLSGEEPATTADEVHLEGLAAVLDGGPAPGGVASTVVLLDRPDPEVTREGGVPARDLLLADQVDKMRWFAEHEVRGASPVYEAVCTHLVDRPDVLELLLEARPGQRRPNLILAAVHYLVLTGLAHPLADYYPSAGGTRPPDAHTGPAFAELALTHADEVRALVRTRATQTNEVARTGPLALVLGWLPQPVALVDVGASAGLNLNLDRYRHDFGPAGAFGPEGVLVRTEAEGPIPTPRPSQVAWRLGIDVAPIDVADEQAVTWLRALVWPDQPERGRLLDAAVAEARRHPPPLVRGDLLAELPAAVAEARGHGTPVVVHSHVLAYLGREDRARFVALCEELGAWRVGYEGRWDGERPTSEVTVNGERVALTSPHGGWVRWVARIDDEGGPRTTVEPLGALVGVHRGGREWLMLHRAQDGPDHEGDWAWGPPAGSRLPGEPVPACAARELEEETGLAGDLRPAAGTGRWAVYTIEAPAGWEPRLSPEHDRYEWLDLAEALRRSRPEAAAEELRRAAASLDPK